MRFDRMITTIDAHAGGEPLRIVTSGGPRLRGTTIAERRAEMRAEHDDFRRTLLFEPRGHADMYGALLSEPVTPEADYGVLFLTNEGYSTMCGHGIIALTTALIETGHHPVDSDRPAITYDTPAGLVRASVKLEQGTVTSVAFENVPAFRLVKDLPITLDDGTRMTVNLVWGGAYYALVSAETLGVTIDPAQVNRLIAAGMDVKRAVLRETAVEHPLDPSLHGLYGTIITAESSGQHADSRNIVIFADGEVDRSPCGTGTSARLAALFADGRIGIDEPFRHESVVRSVFTGRVLSETEFGGYPAVITEISGRGFITGFHQFVVQPDDPFGTGFLLGREWGDR
jgi:trans-L-3-hydroxyproline dehydratase